jgi:hypothetical protein
LAEPAGAAAGLLLICASVGTTKTDLALIERNFWVVLKPHQKSQDIEGMDHALPASAIAPPGAMRDQIQIAADFDAPLDDQFGVLIDGATITYLPA